MYVLKSQAYEEWTMKKKWFSLCLSSKAAGVKAILRAPETGEFEGRQSITATLKTILVKKRIGKGQS